MLGQCLAGLLQVADPRNIGIHVGLLLLAVDLHLRHQQQDAVRVVLKLADLVAADVGALPLQFVQVPLALDPDDPDALPLARVAGRFALSVAIFIVVASEMCASGFNPFIYFQF